MNCETFQNMIPDFLNHSLNPADLAEFKNHQKKCGVCQSEISALQATWDELGAVPEAKPSADLNVRFAALLDGYIQGEKNSKPIRSWRERWQNWWSVPRPGSQFAIAVILLAIGFGLGRFHSPAPEIAQLKQEMTEMRQVLMLSMLSQPSPLTRLSGIHLTRELPEPDSKIISVLLQTIENDPNVNVRLAAIDALARIKTSPQINREMLEALPRQNSPLVQIAMIDFLIAGKNRDAKTIFQQLIQQNGLNPAVKSHLQWGIDQLI